MAEAPRAPSSIVSIIAYGLQLSTNLETYAEGFSDAEEKLYDLSTDISASSAALIQLQQIVENDNAAPETSTRVLKEEGRQEIENVAAQCEKIYKTVIIIVNKAGTSANKGKFAADFGERPVLKPSSLLRDLRWPWLNPRIQRIDEQLRWTKMKVLLNLQLAEIAKVQLGIPTRAPGSFTEELALRVMGNRLRVREKRYFEKLATKYRIKPFEFHSSYNASVLSIPDYVPPMQNHGPCGFRYEPPNEGPSNPVKPAAPEMSKSQPVFSEDEVFVIEEGQDGELKRVPFVKPVEEKIDEPLGPAPPPPPPASSSTRSNTMVPDQQSERGAADLKAATTKVEVEDAKPVEPAPKEPQDEPQAESSTTTDDKLKEDPNEAQSIETVVSALPGYDSKPGFFPSWLTGMFGQNTKLSNDWESQTLEAFILPENSHGILKVPFGHQNLTQGLRRMKKQCLPWDQYTALGSQHHKRISQAVLEAKKLDSRERTCLAVGLNKEYGPERLMVFFLVGAPVEPIHLKDAVGRKYTFPYEQARTWLLMKGLIDAAFLHVEGLANHVNEGHYDLIDEDGKIILPEVYHQIIKPGSKISQHMWPIPIKRPGPPPAPPVVLPGGPPPGPRDWPGGPPPPAGRPPTAPFNRPSGPPVIVNLTRDPPGKAKSTRGVLSWMAGAKSDNSSYLATDSDIEDEPEDLGLEIDFDKEDENAKLTLGELLAKFTNATDTVHDVFTDNEDSSDDDDDDSEGTGSLVSN